MIDAILEGIISLAMFLINILLTPIDAIISNYLPGLSDAFLMVDNLINRCISYVGFVISYTGLTSSTINIIISLSTFLLTVPLMVHGIKISIKWFRALRG